MTWRILTKPNDFINNMCRERELKYKKFKKRIWILLLNVRGVDGNTSLERSEETERIVDFHILRHFGFESKREKKSRNDISFFSSTLLIILLNPFHLTANSRLYLKLLILHPF